MQRKIISAFVISSGVLLTLTSVSKLISSFGTAPILNTRDPVFLISFDHLFQTVAAVELCVASVCFFGKKRILQVGLIAFLASIFLLYRFGLYWEGYHVLCHCLGNLTDALHIPPQTAETAMAVMLAYMLIGSYLSLFWLWTQRAKVVPSASIE